MDDSQTDKFVGMYVNQRTLDDDPDGRTAVQLLPDRGNASGVILHSVKAEWAE